MKTQEDSKVNVISMGDYEQMGKSKETKEGGLSKSISILDDFKEKLQKKKQHNLPEDMELR